MTRAKECLCLFAIVPALWGQSPPAFEVASVKANPAGSPAGARMNEADATITYTNVALQWIIHRAYQVQDFQISGPEWLTAERYDIHAKFPPGTTSKERGAMLQTLLAERFKLAVHRETKVMSAYRLLVDKGGPKLREVDEPPGGLQMRMDGPTRHLRTKLTLTGVALFLGNELHLSVMNETGVKGTFDIALDWTPENLATSDATLPSIFTAIREQLGLRLESIKTPMEIVVVDHAERIPTEN